MRVRFSSAAITTGILTALLAAFAANAPAQTNTTANMTAAITNLCSFPLTAWTMSQADPNPTTSPVGSGTAKVVTGPVTVTKNVDSCSPKLYVASATGQRFSQITFTAPKANQPMLTLSNAIVTAIQQSGNTSGDATETLTFAFASLSTQETGASSAGATDTSISLDASNSSPSCTFSALAWSNGVANPAGAKSQPTALNLTKLSDSCSEGILKTVYSRATIPTLVLTVTKATGQPKPVTVLKITLTSVVPASYNVAGSGSGTMNETVSFLYSTISIEQVSTNPDGTPGAATIDGYNFTSQKSQ